LKRKGKHPEKALTAIGVRQAKTPGRYADGNGLYLEVDPSGAKRCASSSTAGGETSVSAA